MTTKFYERLYNKSLVMYVLLRRLTLTAGFEAEKMPDLSNEENQKPIRDEVSVNLQRLLRIEYQIIKQIESLSPFFYRDFNVARIEFKKMIDELGDEEVQLFLNVEEDLRVRSRLDELDFSFDIGYAPDEFGDIIGEDNEEGANEVGGDIVQ